MNLRTEIFKIVSREGPFTPYDIIQISIDFVEKRIDNCKTIEEVKELLK